MFYRHSPIYTVPSFQVMALWVHGGERGGWLVMMGKRLVGGKRFAGEKGGKGF
jgi:hypothetical protein